MHEFATPQKITEVSLGNLVHQYIKTLRLGRDATVHHEPRKERMELVSFLNFLIKVAAQSIIDSPSWPLELSINGTKLRKKNLVKKIVRQLTA